MKAWLIALAIAATFTGLGVFTSGPAEAAPSPECLAHLQRIGKTEAQDQRYWLERGQLPRKCPLREEASKPSEDKPPASKRDDREEDRDEGKSRFCRKRWYC